MTARVQSASIAGSVNNWTAIGIAAEERYRPVAGVDPRAVSRRSCSGPERHSIRTHAVCSCCMGATRTQVYLTGDQRRMIDEIAQAEGVTLAEVVRRALDAYLRAERDAAAALASTFGADPEASMSSRDEWDRG